MATVLGYLRHYRRWDGRPGLSLTEQRKLVGDACRELKYGPDTKRRYLVEDADGEARGWPQLMKSIRWAQNNFGEDLVVVPTLDGLQYNESFLDLLGGKAD